MAIEKLTVEWAGVLPLEKEVKEKINEIIDVLNEHTQNHLPNTVLKHAHALKGPDS